MVVAFSFSTNNEPLLQPIVVSDLAPTTHPVWPGDPLRLNKRHLCSQHAKIQVSSPGIGKLRPGAHMRPVKLHLIEGGPVSSSFLGGPGMVLWGCDWFFDVLDGSISFGVVLDRSLRFLEDPECLQDVPGGSEKVLWDPAVVLDCSRWY